MIETIEINSLIPDPSNARKHSKKNLDAIKGSLARFGQQKPIVVTRQNVVIAGNGTLAAAKELNWSTLQVIRTSLEGSDITAYGIADNRTSDLAEFDDDILAATLKSLKDVEFDLGSIGFDEKDLDQLLKGDNSRDSLYTNKITPPIYEPKGLKPSLKDLVNTSKRDALVSEINASNLDTETKIFLIKAAERHLVFNYELIAEFYSHLPSEDRDLFEKSALVIIDFDKAIENGFVTLSKDLGEAYQDAESE